MEEETVRKIMSRYFRTKKRKAIPTRGAGPDFIESGKAIEVKGSGVKGAKFNNAISQYAKYAFKYSDLEVAFPIDVLSADNLVKFALFCRIVREVLTKYIKTYLIGKVEQEYFVKEFYDGSQILNILLDRISRWPYFKHELFQDTIDEIDANLSLVNITIEQAFREEIRLQPDMTLSVPEIK